MSNIDSLLPRNAAFAASECATKRRGCRFFLTKGCT